MNNNSDPQQFTQSQFHTQTFGYNLKSPATNVRKLFVGGLPSNITEGEFKSFFEQFGTLLESVVIYDRETGRSRGFGFVTYEDPMVCHHLLMMGNEHSDIKDPLKLVGRIEMQGKVCEIKAATPKEHTYKPRKESGAKESKANKSEVYSEDVQVNNQFEMYGYNYPDPSIVYFPPYNFNNPYVHHPQMDYPMLMNPAFPMAINPQLKSPVPFVPPVGIPIMPPPEHVHAYESAPEQVLTSEQLKVQTIADEKANEEI